MQFLPGFPPFFKIFVPFFAHLADLLIFFNLGSQRKVSDLQNVMSVLGDEEKQAIYDQTGCVDDVFFFKERGSLLRFIH